MLRTHRTRQAPGSLIALAFAFATLSMAAQSPPAPGNEVLLVDFRAVAPDGQPVVDLKAADVELKVGGRARAIKSLELVQLSSRAPSGTPTIANVLPPAFATNASPTVSGPGRDFVLLFDDESILPGREESMRAAVGEFLGALSASDRVTVRSVRQGGLDINATTELGTIRSAMLALRGRGSETEPQSDFTCRSLVSLQAIQYLLQNAAGIVPTYIVYVSGALANIDPQRVAAIGQSSGLCQLRATNLEELGKAAANSAATLYVAHVQEGMGPGGTQERFAAGLENVAGTTGAEIVRISGTNQTALSRIARETSSYYIAGFEPEAGERNDARRPVEVRVARDRVKVHARRSIVIPKTIGSAAGKSVSPRDMLRASVPFADLQLRAAAYTSRNPGDSKVRIVALFEPVDPAAKVTAASIGLFDASGTLKYQWTAQGDELKRMPLMGALVAAPGTYRIRVVATDASGRAGAVDSTVEAQVIPASPLNVSALVLGVPQAGSFAPRLRFSSADQQAIGYLEIYGVPQGANLGVTFELAESENGPALATGAGNLAAGSGADVRQAYGGFAIAAMKEGEVLVRAVVTLDGKVVGRVMRTLRKM